MPKRNINFGFIYLKGLGVAAGQQDSFLSGFKKPQNKD